MLTSLSHSLSLGWRPPQGSLCAAQLRLYQQRAILPHSVSQQGQQALHPDQLPQNGLESNDHSADLMQLFAKAQQNLMEVNRSRLNALQELGAAQARITELEQQLHAAQTGRSEQQHRSPLSEQPQAEQAAALPEQREVHSLQPSLAEQQAQQSKAGSITVAYQTGWHQAFLHFRTDTADWTRPPGREMLPGVGDLGNSRVLTIEARRLEFVVNNGKEDWDTPDPYGVGTQQNYVIEGPGAYRLKSGRVNRL